MAQTDKQTDSLKKKCDFCLKYNNKKYDKMNCPTKTKKIV